jgi:hypothetical protein
MVPMLELGNCPERVLLRAAAALEELREAQANDSRALCARLG